MQQCEKEEAKKKGIGERNEDGGGGSGPDPLFPPKMECN